MKTSRTFLKVTLPIIAALLVLTHPVHAALAAYHTAAISNNPYLYYELGKTSGTTANDSSGNGGFDEFACGFRLWASAPQAFNVYYDDIALDTQRIGPVHEDCVEK